MNNSEIPSWLLPFFEAKYNDALNPLQNLIRLQPGYELAVVKHLEAIEPEISRQEALPYTTQFHLLTTFSPEIDITTTPTLPTFADLKPPPRPSTLNYLPSQ